MRLIAALAAVLLLAPAREARDRTVRAEFQRANPCPDPAARIRAGTAGGRRGACRGFEVDHVVALCAGGADAIVNMQWLSVELHRLKTREDLRTCRSRRNR